MGKLVRDKIPQIIKDAGKTPIIEILSDKDYLRELDKKLNEEVAEYQADKSIEEIADILEVLYAICEARGYSVEQLMQVKAKKQEERGGFVDKIYWFGNEETERERKSKAGKTLVVGYVNRNDQENRGCLNKPGNHYNQTAYLMRCNRCGHEYEANGCDIAIRKCPKCM